VRWTGHVARIGNEKFRHITKLMFLCISWQH